MVRTEGSRAKYRLVYQRLLATGEHNCKVLLQLRNPMARAELMKCKYFHQVCLQFTLPVILSSGLPLSYPSPVVSDQVGEANECITQTKHSRVILPLRGVPEPLLWGTWTSVTLLGLLTGILQHTGTHEAQSICIPLQRRKVLSNWLIRGDGRAYNPWGQGERTGEGAVKRRKGISKNSWKVDLEVGERDFLREESKGAQSSSSGTCPEFWNAPRIGSSGTARWCSWGRCWVPERASPWPWISVCVYSGKWLSFSQVLLWWGWKQNYFGTQTIGRIFTYALKWIWESPVDSLL